LQLHLVLVTYGSPHCFWNDTESLFSNNNINFPALKLANIPTWTSLLEDEVITWRW